MGYRLLVIFLCVFISSAKADVLGDFHFEGTLGDKIGVSIEFAVNGDYVAVGEIVYTNHKKPVRFLIVGTWTGDEYLLNEYKTDGTVTGCLRMRIDDTTYNEPILTEGSWSNPKSGQVYQMKNMEYIGTSSNSFWDYAKEEDIDGEYVYRHWDLASNSWKNGHATFRLAGGHKVRFEVINEMPDSYYKSLPGRPADLTATTYNSFYYKEANDCGYTFSAHFFKNFVVLISEENPEAAVCSGKKNKVDGVYFKLKNEK
jgi:hypothetical protein